MQTYTNADPHTPPPHVDPARGPRPTAGDPRGLGDLIRELKDEATLLFKQEVTLAKTEAAEKANAIGKDVAGIVVGGLVFYMGTLVLIAALTFGLFALMTVLGLNPLVGMWLAPLIVGGLLAIVGGTLLKSALDKLKHRDTTPDQTIQSMKENQQWIAAKTN
jgi:hypothetical protein